MRGLTCRLLVITAFLTMLGATASADTLTLADGSNTAVENVVVMGVHRAPEGTSAIVLATPEALAALRQAGVEPVPFSNTPDMVRVDGVAAVQFTDLPTPSPTDMMSPANQMMAAFGEAAIRSKVSRVRADMRSMATAIEAYYIDNNAYPASIIGSSPLSVSQGNPLLAAMPTFRRGVPMGPGLPPIPSTLTTPVAYVTELFRDPFNSHVDTLNTFSYHTDGAGWILISPGPDEDFDLTAPASVYSSAVAQPSLELLQYSYDPTNGTISSGDVFRVRQ